MVWIFVQFVSNTCWLAFFSAWSYGAVFLVHNSAYFFCKKLFWLFVNIVCSYCFILLVIMDVSVGSCILLSCVSTSANVNVWCRFKAIAINFAWGVDFSLYFLSPIFSFSLRFFPPLSPFPCLLFHFFLLEVGPLKSRGSGEALWTFPAGSGLSPSWIWCILPFNMTSTWWQQF